MGSERDRSPAKKKLRIGAIVLGGLALTAFWFWNDNQHTEQIYFVGGSAHAPLVVSKHHESTSGEGSNSSRSWYVSSIWVPGAENPVGEVETNANPLRLGASSGERFWIGAGQTPVLVDRRGTVHLDGENLRAKGPLADGYRLARPAHPGFDGPIHGETGAVALHASNSLVYVMTADDELLPWDEFVAAHPPPEQRRCTGGTWRVCETLGCVGFEPDPAGGERVVLDGAALSPSLHGPRVASGGACLRSPDGGVAFVVAHRSLPGNANAAPDAWSAFGLEGSHLWTRPVGELFGDAEVRSAMAEVVDGSLVVGAVVKDFLHGTRVRVAVVRADGTLGRAPN